MSEDQQIEDELPCGGYAEEDRIIEKNMKQLSDQVSKIQINSFNKLQKQNKCLNQDCSQFPQKQSNQQNCRFQQSKCCTHPKIDEYKKIKCEIPVCKKCSAEPSALRHKNEPICRQCLLKNIEYKCRLSLENSMKVTQKSKVLVCFSGGLNSICLVSILSNLKKRYLKHRLFGEIRCIHIQQQQTIPEHYKQNFEKEMGISLEIIKIEQVFEEQNKQFSDVRKLFSMFNTNANTADLLVLLRDRLIINYAKNHQFDFVVKGLNTQTIACSIFKFFTKGIGGNVTQLSSNEQDSLFHYPLRQHLQKELQYYFYTLNCSKISLESQSDDLSYLCSNDLDNHLNDFVFGLQATYSHTAPAIARTSQKIESNKKNQMRCKWCMLKGVIQEHELCRKCERMYQCKNKNYDVNEIPKWFASVK